MNGIPWSADQRRILTWSETARRACRRRRTAADRPTRSSMKDLVGCRAPTAAGILTWSGDGTARLWEAADSEDRGPPMRHGRFVSGAVSAHRPTAHPDLE